MIVTAGGQRGHDPGFRLPHLIVWVVLILGWQLWIWLSGTPELIAPSPSEVAAQFAHPGWLLQPLLFTVGTSLLGSAIGMTLGCALAIIAWLIPAARMLVLPPAIILGAVPLVVFAPVIGLIVGFGNSAVLTMTVAIALLPTLIFMDAGLRAMTPSRIDLMRVLGASRMTILRQLSLPSCVPSLAVALRITSATAILAAFTVDYLVGSDGLGHFVADQEYFLQTARIWGASLAAIIVSVVFYLAASALSARLTSRFEAG